MSHYIGKLKIFNTDFFVEEELGFKLTGYGEHIWLYIEKEGCNTKDILRALALFTGLKPRDIGYSGLKDKHAVTRQWLSLYYPGKIDIDFSGFNLAAVKILQITRHNKKLKIGNHKANFFRIVLRDLTLPFEKIEHKLHAITTNGFINLFGEQRFGHDNLQQAHDLIDGKLTLNPKDKGFLLSVMRSFLFNAYAEFRQQYNTAHIALLGDIVGFTDGNTVFQVTQDTQKEIQQRIIAKELCLAAPLIGKQQKLFFSDLALEQYTIFCAHHHKFIDYLTQHTDMQFRSMYAFPRQLNYDYDQINNSLKLSFHLPTGAYATSLVGALN